LRFLFFVLLAAKEAVAAAVAVAEVPGLTVAVAAAVAAEESTSPFSFPFVFFDVGVVDDVDIAFASLISFECAVVFVLVVVVPFDESPPPFVVLDLDCEGLVAVVAGATLAFFFLFRRRLLFRDGFVGGDCLCKRIKGGCIFVNNRFLFFLRKDVVVNLGERNYFFTVVFRGC